MTAGVDGDKVYDLLLIRSDPTGRAAVVFEHIRGLTSGEYLRYFGAYHELIRMLNTNIYSFVIESAKVLMATFSEIAETIESGEMSNVNPQGGMDASVLLRYAVLAFCSSIYSHQEQTLILVKRKFGNTSNEVEAALQAFHTIYDGCFAYRYLTKLRHAMIHVSVEAVSTHTYAMLIDGKPAAIADAWLDRTALLEPGSRLSAALKAELKGLPGDPSVLQMIGELLPEMSELNSKMLRILYPELEEVKSTIVELESFFNGRQGGRAFASIDANSESRPFNERNFSYQALAPSVLDFVHG